VDVKKEGSGGGDAATKAGEKGEKDSGKSLRDKQPRQKGGDSMETEEGKADDDAAKVDDKSHCQDSGKERDSKIQVDGAVVKSEVNDGKDMKTREDKEAVIEIKDEEEEEDAAKNDEADEQPEEKIPEKPVPAVHLDGEDEFAGEYDDNLLGELLMCWSYIQRMAASVGLRPMNFDAFLRECTCACACACAC
jgi:hypothetical protein